MEKITGNEPAFPFWDYNSWGYIYYDAGVENNVLPFNRGLTIRQYFAGLAMQALYTEGTLTLSQISRYAVEQADGLIKKLNDTPNPNENP